MKLPKAYEPGKYESEIYKLWENSGSFAPKNRGNHGYFSLVAPPPNANASLHIGYGMTLALEDIAVRYNRLRGKATLFVPGADHAGFETQVVYEKQLAKEGKSRFDFSREELYKQIWEFVAQNRHTFESQFRALGASVDWDHFTFTLDDKIIKRAYATFKKMWDEHLIYRGERLVNFCTFHGTAFADIEVEFKEEPGKLWYIRYPLTDGSGEVVVATTRPETMLGDTAVAVHPDDPKYKQFVGKTVKLPLTNREIPVIADDMVEREFGTGAVKITPAHDQNDYEVALRHDLPFITVVDHEGKMTHEATEPYAGMKVEEAREAVVKDLDKQGDLVKTENYIHSVGHCYKCGTVIQPLLREQWFVDMQSLSKDAIKALKANEITFYPSSKKDQLIRYLEGLRDWNISRQIAWGIPIPAFQNVSRPDDWIFDERVGEEQIEVDGQTYKRDPDVFDTWFSSSSWPYATLDFPDGDFKKFYPLSLMETGGEILYPWVSRMVMMGLYVTGNIPFKAVYIHGYVMAEDGSKISKSKGNAPDLQADLDLYGSDALRMGIISGRSPAVNRGYDRRRLEEARNFCNKLWNVARFIEDKLDGQKVTPKPEPQSVADHWILTKLQQCSRKITVDLDNYRFSEAYDTLYHFVWDDFADWYIETSKKKPNLELLAYSIETILTLAHPFAPFVTETIWQTLGWSDELLIIHPWPEVKAGDAKQTSVFEEIRQIVSEIRHISTLLHASYLNLYYIDAPFLEENSVLIKKLARLASIKRVEAGQGLHLTQTKIKCWLDIDHDTAKRFQNSLAAKQAQQAAVVERLKTRLDNKSYVNGAPRELVQQTRDQLAEAEAAFDKITEELRTFNQASKDL